MSWIHDVALRTFGRLPPRLRVLIVRVMMPSHTVGSLCLLEHDGHLLLLRQQHRQGWTLPGGLLERGESADQGAVRELAEETGLHAEVGLPFAALVEPRSRRVDVLFHIPVDRRMPVKASGEAIEAAWLRPEEAQPVDEPTATAFAALRRSKEAGAWHGRVLDP